MRTVWLDAYSDEVDLPPEAREAQAALFRLGEDRGRGDPGMGIELNVERPDHMRLLRVFAPWSINVELYDEAMRWVADLHDCGYSVYRRQPGPTACARVSAGEPAPRRGRH